MKSFLRSTVLTAGVLSVSVALSLLAAELLVRVVRPQPRLIIAPPGLYLPDPPGRHQLSAGYRGRIYNRTEFSTGIWINAHGLRGAEILPESEGRLRILVVGDSFAFGVGVEDDETFASVVADRLTRQGIPAEGLNAGIPDFGIPDAVGWLERHGVGLQPDVVVLAVFLGNDLADASPTREESLIIDGLLTPSQSPGGVRAWLHRRSHLFVLAKSLLDRPALLPLRARLGLGEPWSVRTLRTELAVYRRAPSADQQRSVELTDVALARLVSLCRKHEIELVALLIPAEIQLDRDRWRETLVTLGLDPADYDSEAPTRIFRELLDSHSIAALEVAPRFADGMNEGVQLYYRYDRHWTARGHTLAGEELARFLRVRLAGRLESKPGASR